MRGARWLAISRISVTWATHPQSITCNRALRVAAPLAGRTAPVLGHGSGREREGGGFQQACNRLATCLQLACNYGHTPALLRCCPSAARAPRARSCAAHEQPLGNALPDTCVCWSAHQGSCRTAREGTMPGGSISGAKPTKRSQPASRPFCLKAPALRNWQPTCCQVGIRVRIGASRVPLTH